MTATYTHSPKPFGGPISFTLEGDRLTVDSGRKVHEVRLGAVDTVRMTYEPGRLAKGAFRTKVVMKDGKSFTFGSLDWRSLVEAQELTREYRTFAQALCRAIVRANPEAKFVAGKPLWLWAPSSALAVASLLAMLYLIWQAFSMGARDVALLGGLLAFIGVWQIAPMLRLNKPRPFRSEALPEELLPKAG
ncbi:hypothetical protein [Microvirga arsenatis]|uniref:DUF2207 domain-containing protein n=1 Tax=Microvirga arsenatis TaxID=2692265 RepID=A0ABW9YVW3_9HYPH|nr:hypothetical protein [Microvirga arsenatis]NBJ10797.1 hypothetical protein [Microvirga arsenatis]NBJ24305.1 hypothetical protein [Microvirga arsenatis]